jgi:hypothetical protein
VFGRLETAPVIDKFQHFVFVTHEVGAAVSGDNNSPAGVPHARRFVPIPTMDQTVNKTAGKSVASPQNIVNIDRETRASISWLSAVKMVAPFEPRFTRLPEGLFGGLFELLH